MSNIQHTAVVGAGRMGKAIAIAFAYAGLQVKLIDAKERSCEDFVQYQQQVEQDITQELLLLSEIQFIQTAQISSIQANIEVLSKSTSIQYLNQCDLVLEGVPEKIQVKQDIFYMAGSACCIRLYSRFYDLYLFSDRYCQDAFSS